MNKKITVGLFGTCGDSQWRTPFINQYVSRGIDYFNPVKDDWKPEDAQIEADHLANDDVILFPVTNETYGMGSLGEIGFSILQAIKLDVDRAVVVMIEQNLDVMDKNEYSLLDLARHEALKKESLRARALVAAHLRKLNYPNVYVVETMEKMMHVSLMLCQALEIKNNIKKFTI